MKSLRALMWFSLILALVSAPLQPVTVTTAAPVEHSTRATTPTLNTITTADYPATFTPEQVAYLRNAELPGVPTTSDQARQSVAQWTF